LNFVRKETLVVDNSM